MPIGNCDSRATDCTSRLVTAALNCCQNVSLASWASGNKVIRQIVLKRRLVMRTSRYSLIFCLLLLSTVAIGLSLSHARSLAASSAQSFTVEQIKSYPFPNELTTAKTGARIAWAFNERGARNVWVADAPDFKPRKLTNYNTDDGQELTSLAISSDGKFVVYVRGGDHGANWDISSGVDPASSPAQTRVQLWSVPFAGGEPKLLSDGDEPAISPKSDRVVFVKEHAIWSVPIDGSSPAKRLFYARGEADSMEYSPDGSRLAFVSGRGDHSFIGVYTNDATPILYLSPSTARDSRPRWSEAGGRW